MARELGYPHEWLERVPAMVFACLVPGELRITLCPGNPHANGGAPLDVPMDTIPFDLRTPNTPLWVHFDENWTILRVWRRDEEPSEHGP
jgi:hypothetical protein